MKFNKRFEKWLSLEYTVTSQLINLYSIYLGQCNEDMKATLAEHPDFDKANKEKDVFTLLKILQGVNFSYVNSEEPIVTMFKAKYDFIRIRQQRGQSVTDYYERFIAMKEVNESLNTNIHDDLGFTAVIAKEKGKDLDTMTDDEKSVFEDEAFKEGRNRMAAIHLLFGADPDQFSGLLKDLRHMYLMNKKNEYPKTLHDAYVLLKGWGKGKNANPKQPVGVAFNVNGQEEDGIQLVNKGSYSGPPCDRCGRSSHPTNKCHAKTHDDGTVLHISGESATGSLEEQVSTANSVFGTISDNAYGLMFLNSERRGGRSQTTSSRASIPETWILLDSQSTIDVFSNPALLRDIHSIKTTMHINCNAGSKSTNLRGYLTGYGWVWYFPDGIANILSLSHMLKNAFE